MPSNATQSNQPMPMYIPRYDSFYGREARFTLSTLSRWFMYNVSHAIFYSIKSKTSSAPIPPLDRCLSLPIPRTRRIRPQADIAKIHDQTKFTITNPSLHAFDANGTLVSRIEFSDKDKRWYFYWDRFPAYGGCHGGAGMMYWMLRSINIPSDIITTYENHPQDHPANPDPNQHHRGIRILIPTSVRANQTQDQSLCVYHMDELFALPDKYDPVIDPMNLFVSQTIYDEWFSISILNLHKNNPIALQSNFKFFRKFLGIAYCYNEYQKNIANTIKTDLDWQPTSISPDTLAATTLELLRKEQISSLLITRLYTRERMIEQLQGIPPGFLQSIVFGQNKSRLYDLDYAKFFSDKVSMYHYLLNIFKTAAENPTKEIRT